MEKLKKVKKLFLLSDIERLGGNVVIENYIKEEKIYYGKVLLGAISCPVYVRYDVFKYGYVCGIRADSVEQAEKAYEGIKNWIVNAIESGKGDEFVEMSLTKIRYLRAFFIGMLISLGIMLYNVIQCVAFGPRVNAVMGVGISFISAFLCRVFRYRTIMQ